MAELASGAVGTLLGVISHEALRLGRVRHDVQFIQEEMESMGSFLANLSGNSREHDEQVRTWMNQVRILANDCNNCIDLYLYRGDPALHLPKEGPGRYLRWAPWLVRKLLAQHRAAGQLRELKDRAQDIGNRRMRYGVEVKTESSSSRAGLTEPLLLPAPQDHEDEADMDNDQDGVDPLKVALSMTSMRMDKEDFFQRRLDQWIGLVVQVRAEAAEKHIKSNVAESRKLAAESKPLLPSIAFVVTDNEDANANAHALGSKALEVARAYFEKAEDIQDKVVPPEMKHAGALTREDKAVPPKIKDVGALAHEDKGVPPEIKNVGGLAREDKAMPLETKDAGALACEDKAMPQEIKDASPVVPPEIKDASPVVSPETKDNGALVHEDIVVPPEVKDANALVHEDKAIPSETREDGALTHKDKAMPPKIKDADALVDEDKVVVPPETKHIGAIRTKIRRKPMRLLCMKIRRLCHRRPRTPVVLLETKDASALVNEDKPVPQENRDASGALVHGDTAVPPETKGTGALEHKDMPAVPPETSDANNALMHKDKVAVQDTGYVVILVDVPEVHYDFITLRPHKILCYIMAELKRQQGTKQDPPKTRWGTYKYTRDTIRDIKQQIDKMKADSKINDIKICTLKDGMKELPDRQKLRKDGIDLEKEILGKNLDQLLWLLIYQSTTTAAASESEKEKKNKSMVAELYDAIIKQTAKKLKSKIEAGSSSEQLEGPEYEDILSTVFPRSISTTITAGNSPLVGTSVDDEIKEMVRGVKDMLHELRELEKSAKNPEVIPEDDFDETRQQKKDEIITEIRNRLKIKMMAQKIKECLRGDDQRILVILKVYDKYIPQWEETRNTLRPRGLGWCPIAGAVIVATKTTQQDIKQYCGCQELEPIEYSLVGLYLDTVLQNTGQHMNDQPSRQVLRDILCKCEPHEFCMKIFAHALYTKPKRSSGELSKLNSTLPAGATQKSLPTMMFKFSYRDLPKEYRSCLLYLAIFPGGKIIRRSTLVGRWVAEGLITTKDWRWSSSVDEAEKCFDTLIARCFVCPAGIDATGKVKSCTVHKLVYGFITKIAMKQRILETRLSHHLARHFSIFSDVRLRSSETIENFLKNSSQFSKLKVLDLEGCDCFPQNQHYLSHICRNILMLKYLSLRGTGVTRLPSAINNLHELEVLDIRDTEIHASATRHVLLQKLKRFLAGQKLKRVLAGHVDSSQSSPSDSPSVQMPEINKMECVEVPCNVKPKNRWNRLLSGHVDSSPADFSSVQIPEKIEKMVGVEVLSNVKPKNEQDLKDIGGLNELKKLGVAINKESDLKSLLNAISDLLNQSLRYLSITLDIDIYKVPPSELSLKQNCPDVLERLSINESTSTQKGQLLKILVGNGNQLAKVTLTGTSLSQEDLNILAKLENLHCVKLRHNKYDESKLTFNKGEFKNLKNFLVEGNNMTEITFDDGAASNLEKIVLSSTNIVSISGVGYLKKLEELELNNIKNKGILHSLLFNAKHITRLTLRDTLLEQGDLEILARKRKMRYLALFGKFYNGSQLIFNKDEFQKLNFLIVGSSYITELSFTDGSPNLEKIVWSFKNIVSMSGIDKLPALKELELNGDSVPNDVEQVIKKLKNRLEYKHKDKPKKQEEKQGGPARCPSLWKAKDWCWRN
ncbi:uncharacterized protein LOC119357214 [Triticum dicoccoides]|uniref:uncharacterized protein LOC119357214 n=1 Tax=Triticum dicoccoides TaxID=85692 RepID=UPI00188F85A1|nr:uncharacterized protein LOC119357214 [Triticum dicoccoides]